MSLLENKDDLKVLVSIIESSLICKNQEIVCAAYQVLAGR